MGSKTAPLPTFLIVGAMKSGTSTLAAHLRQHPEVYMPRKELHYFNSNPRPEENLHEYRSFFSGWSGEREVGEKTPGYSVMPDGPGLISRVLPDVKVFWCFRDPVERAYSNYWHAVKRGRESRSFDTAVRRELQRGRSQQDDASIRSVRRYVTRSDYVEQIERFLDHFEPGRMHYMLLEDLKTDPEGTLEKVIGFLGVDPELTTPPDLHEHQTHLPRLRWAQYAAHGVLGDGPAFKRFASMNRRKSPGYPPMSQKTWRLLSETFEQWYPDFERYTGLSTSKWSSAGST